MPNYEYKCTQDGSTFEIWQEVGADAPPCPTCGAATKKVFQPPRVIFKGSGFYLTDLRSEQGKSGGSEPSSTSSSSTSSSSTSSSPSAESSSSDSATSSPNSTTE